MLTLKLEESALVACALMVDNCLACTWIWQLIHSYWETNYCCI